MYAVGWIKRGPTGVIGTNKPDGDIAAKQIIADIKESKKPGRIALISMLKERNVRVVNYQDWQKIDAAEITAANEQAPRKKFVTVKEMISALD